MHAPGQLVVYPILPVGRQIRAHIEELGAVCAALAADYGIEGAKFRMDHPGVWVGDKKLASIGIHVSRGVAVQGVAMNFTTDPALFEALVSCGLPRVEVSSVLGLGGPRVEVRDAARRWAERYAGLRGRGLQWIDDEA